MPDKHPNTERWSGPGASHEDRSKPQPQAVNEQAGKPTNTKRSQVSSGGGERHTHHTHDPQLK